MEPLKVVEFLLAGMTDNSGEPLAAGLVYTYSAGTTSSKATYTDITGTTPADNPIELDSNGRAQIYANGNYKFVIQTADNETLYTWDNLRFGIVGNYVSTVGGSANAITLSPSSPATSYSDGDEYIFKAASDNTSSVTINVSNLGAKSTFKETGLNPLGVGDIVANNFYRAIYDSTSGAFHIKSMASGHILGRTSTDVTYSNSTADNVLYTKSVAANTLKSYKGLRLTAFGTFVNNSASDVNYGFTLKFGSTDIAVATIEINSKESATKAWMIEAIVLANNSASAQKGIIKVMMIDDSSSKGSETFLKYGTASEDSSAALNLILKCIMDVADASTSVTLKGAIVEFL